MISPVVLVTSSDPVLGQRAVEGVLAQLRADDPDAEVRTHVGSELEGLPELRTQSLFGGRTVVVVLHAETMSAGVQEEVLGYLAGPDPAACLVLAMHKVGRARKVVDTVRTMARQKKSALATVVAAEPPPEFRDQEWKAIVRDEFGRHRRRVEERAVDTLLEKSGFDVSVIAAKVAQLVGAIPSGTISRDQVEEQLEGYGRRSGFAVADACVARDAGLALALLRGALEAGDEPVMLLGGLVFRLRQLLQVRSGMTAEELGMGPYPYKLAMQAAKRFGPGELGAAHRALARADVDLKGSDLPPETVLELVVMEVAGVA